MSAGRFPERAYSCQSFVLFRPNVCMYLRASAYDFITDALLDFVAGTNAAAAVVAAAGAFAFLRFLSFFSSAHMQHLSRQLRQLAHFFLWQVQAARTRGDEDGGNDVSEGDDEVEEGGVGVNDGDLLLLPRPKAPLEDDEVTVTFFTAKFLPTFLPCAEL